MAAYLSYEIYLERLNVALLYFISNILILEIAELILNIVYQANELLKIEKISLYYRAEVFLILPSVKI